MRSWKLLIGLLAVFGLIAASCGNDDDEPAAGNDSQAVQPTEEAAAEPSEQGSEEAPAEPSDEQMGELSLEGLTVGVAVVGTQRCFSTYSGFSDTPKFIF